MENPVHFINVDGPLRVRLSTAIFGGILAWLIGMGFGYIIWS